MNEKKKVTSAEIKIALAEKHGGDFFLTECKSGSTWMTPKGDMKILDALAIRKSWTRPCFTGYEIKVSRGDFLRDAKFYTYEELCNCLYIVCPKGMIERTELPESVGLMYYDPEKKTLTTRKKAIFRLIEYSPDLLLYIIFSRLDSDRYPFFSSREEHFRAYVEHRESSRCLGRHVSSRLIQENAELVGKLEAVERFRQENDEYWDIVKVLDAHHIWSWSSKTRAQALDEALSRTCPEDISSIRKSLEVVVERLRRIEETKPKDQQVYRGAEEGGDGG